MQRKQKQQELNGQEIDALQFVGFENCVDPVPKTPRKV